MTSAAYIKARRPRAVWDRPDADSRLLPKSSPTTVSLSKPTSGDGRSIDCTRHVPYQDLCRISAPSHGRFRLADFTLAEDFRTYLYVFTRAYVPFLDSSLAAIGLLPLAHDDLESIRPSHAAVERCCWTEMPHSEAPSISVSLLRHVWGFSGTAADAQHPLYRMVHPLRRTNSVDAGVVVFPFTGLGPSIAYSLTSSPVGASLVGAIPAAVGGPSLSIRPVPPRQPTLKRESIPSSSPPAPMSSRGSALQVEHPPREDPPLAEREESRICPLTYLPQTGSTSAPIHTPHLQERSPSTHQYPHPATTTEC